MGNMTFYRSKALKVALKCRNQSTRGVLTRCASGSTASSLRLKKDRVDTIVPNAVYGLPAQFHVKSTKPSAHLIKLLSIPDLIEIYERPERESLEQSFQVSKFFFKSISN